MRVLILLLLLNFSGYSQRVISTSYVNSMDSISIYQFSSTMNQFINYYPWYNTVGDINFMESGIFYGLPNEDYIDESYYIFGKFSMEEFYGYYFSIGIRFKFR